MNVSLRLRFFLITWPLVVLAVAAVALAFDRWAQVELERVDTYIEGGAPAAALAAAEERVRGWAAAGGGDTTDVGSDLGRDLAALAARHGLDFALLDAEGGLLLATDPTIELAREPAFEPGGPAARPTGAVGFRRTPAGGGERTVQQFELTGVPVAGADGTLYGVLFALPPRTPAGEGAPTLRADARRLLWTAVLVSSLAAALLALLLAAPLVARVGRLAAAARRLGGGELSARVAAGGGDEIAELGRAFNRMGEALERAEAQKRSLVSDVAHELRTPLTNVVALLEAIEDGLRTPDPPTLATLRAEADLLVELVDDLLELSLAESGQLELAVEPVDVVREAAAAVEASRPTAADVALAGPPPQDALFARADRRRLAQALRALLRNALAYTPPGGRVEVGVRAEDGWVAVAVADTGPGIPAAHLPLVWERFHRVDPSRNRATGGRGLGLAIVKQLVEAMGGRVEVKSRQGEGSTFTLRLVR